MTNKEVKLEWRKLGYTCIICQKSKTVKLSAPYDNDTDEEVSIDSVFTFVSCEREYRKNTNDEESFLMLSLPFITKEGYVVSL